MVVATRYKLFYDSAQSVYLVKYLEVPVCPKCGAALSGYDHRRRTVIGMDGEPRAYLLRRLRCPACGQLHLELPDFFLPQKHYSKEVITEAQAGNDAQCPADDSTIRRWKK